MMNTQTTMQTKTQADFPPEYGVLSALLLTAKEMSEYDGYVAKELVYVVALAFSDWGMEPPDEYHLEAIRILEACQPPKHPTSPAQLVERNRRFEKLHRGRVRMFLNRTMSYDYDLYEIVKTRLKQVIEDFDRHGDVHAAMLIRNWIL